MMPPVFVRGIAIELVLRFDGEQRANYIDIINNRYLDSPGEEFFVWGIPCIFEALRTAN